MLRTDKSFFNLVKKKGGGETRTQNGESISNCDGRKATGSICKVLKIVFYKHDRGYKRTYEIEKKLCQ